MDSATGSTISHTNAPRRGIVVSKYRNYEDQPRNEVDTRLSHEGQ